MVTLLVSPLAPVQFTVHNIEHGIERNQIIHPVAMAQAYSLKIKSEWKVQVWIQNKHFALILYSTHGLHDLMSTATTGSTAILVQWSTRYEMHTQ